MLPLTLTNIILITNITLHTVNKAEELKHHSYPPRQSSLPNNVWQKKNKENIKKLNDKQIIK